MSNGGPWAVKPWWAVSVSVSVSVPVSVICFGVCGPFRFLNPWSGSGSVAASATDTGTGTGTGTCTETEKTFPCRPTKNQKAQHQVPGLSGYDYASVHSAGCGATDLVLPPAAFTPALSEILIM